MFPMRWYIAVCIETYQRHDPASWWIHRFDTSLHLVGTWYFTSAYNCNIILNINHLTRLFTNNSCYHQGFFAVKRRTVFILGAKWIALARGWRWDWEVGGMETRFQWRKAHSRTARCEAFHFAPRLFFMFLFLIPSTIRQQCIIYLQDFSTEP